MNQAIASCTGQSLPNRYARHDFRAFGPQTVACRRSAHDVFVVRLHTDARSRSSTARSSPGATERRMDSTRHSFRSLHTVPCAGPRLTAAGAPPAETGPTRALRRRPGLAIGLDGSRLAGRVLVAGEPPRRLIARAFLDLSDELLGASRRTWISDLVCWCRR